MNDKTDQQLLRDFAERHSEAAFTELVRRYVDLVHSAAFRMTGEAHSAQDVTQAVFMALAQNAPRLTHHPVLSGWLHTTARNLAAKYVRATVRRQNHEQEAAAMNELLSTTPDASWDEIALHLDAALGELSEPDRDAILLRYFEKKTAGEIAACLGTSAEAAQKRVSRAVEHLRELFSKRGVSVGAGGLALVISANAVQAAPAGLTAIISAVALSGTTFATTATVAATKTIAMTTLQKTIVTATIAVLVGTTIYEAHQASILRNQVLDLRRQVMSLPSTSNELVASASQDKLNLLAAENAELTNELAGARADATRFAAERERANHSAAVFKELADQASSGDKSATNDYPTSRHVMAGWGKIGRLSVQLNRDEDKLTPEEKSANAAARAIAVGELAKLMNAMKQLEMIKSPTADRSQEDPSDELACLLYGALNLNEQQFSEVYGLLQKQFRQAKESRLIEANPTPDASAALQQMADQSNAEIRRLLTTEQAKIFEEISPHVQLGMGKVDFNFKF